MAESKKFYWLKLRTDFFNQREIKKLRKIAGGDTFTIIYLKMQLFSVRNDGVLTFEGTEEGLDEQLALELDEDVENVRLTLAFMQQNHLIEQVSGDDFMLPEAIKSMGKETDSAERMRKHRAKNKQLAQQCDAPVTDGDDPVLKSDTEIRDKSIELRDKSKEIRVKKKNLSEAEASDSPILFTLPLNDHSDYPITEEQITTWSELYPAVDVMQELRKMKGWLDANRTKRKTRNGILRFMNSWLSKQQDAGVFRPPKKNVSSSNPFLDMLREERMKNGPPGDSEDIIDL